MQATNLLPKQNETGRKNLPGNIQGWVKTGLLFGLLISHQRIPAIPVVASTDIVVTRDSCVPKLR